MSRWAHVARIHPFGIPALLEKVGRAANMPRRLGLAYTSLSVQPGCDFGWGLILSLRGRRPNVFREASLEATVALSVIYGFSRHARLRI